jgi:hypothetical protein
MYSKSTVLRSSYLPAFLAWILAAFFAFFSAGHVCFAEVKVLPSLEWINYGEKRNFQAGSINLEDPTSPNPDTLLVSELRPRFKVTLDTLTLVVRPTVSQEVTSALKDKERLPEKSTSRSSLPEAFVSWNTSDHLQLTLGLQNYQWGAAETLNPSNRIFFDNVSNKGAFSTQVGKPIARVNLTAGQNFSLVLLTETEPVREQDRSVYRYGEEFQSKSMAKAEFSWSGSADYIGFVFGSRQTDGQWFGEYFNFDLYEGLSFYGDLSHERGSKAWYPQVSVAPSATPPGFVAQFDMLQLKEAEKRIYTLGVAGVRYAFEGGSDLRIEYLHNQAGYDKDERKILAASKSSFDPNVLSSSSSPSESVKNQIGRMSRPGLDFLGQKYGLISIRIPDLFDVKDLQWYVRYFRSLSDQSAQVYSSVDYQMTDHTALIVSAFGVHGSADSESLDLVRGLGALGVKVVY